MKKPSKTKWSGALVRPGFSAFYMGSVVYELRRDRCGRIVDISHGKHANVTVLLKDDTAPSVFTLREARTHFRFTPGKNQHYRSPEGIVYEMTMRFPDATPPSVRLCRYATFGDGPATELREVSMQELATWELATWELANSQSTDDDLDVDDPDSDDLNDKDTTDMTKRDDKAIALEYLKAQAESDPVLAAAYKKLSAVSPYSVFKDSPFAPVRNLTPFFITKPRDGWDAGISTTNEGEPHSVSIALRVDSDDLTIDDEAADMEDTLKRMLLALPEAYTALHKLYEEYNSLLESGDCGRARSLEEDTSGPGGMATDVLDFVQGLTNTILGEDLFARRKPK